MCSATRGPSRSITLSGRGAHLATHAAAKTRAAIRRSRAAVTRPYGPTGPTANSTQSAHRRLIMARCSARMMARGPPTPRTPLRTHRRTQRPAVTRARRPMTPSGCAANSMVTLATGSTRRACGKATPWPSLPRFPSISTASTTKSSSWALMGRRWRFQFVPCTYIVQVDVGHRCQSQKRVQHTGMTTLAGSALPPRLAGSTSSSSPSPLMSVLGCLPFPKQKIRKKFEDFFSLHNSQDSRYYEPRLDFTSLPITQ
jgi:hypothetical protein